MSDALPAMTTGQGTRADGTVLVVDNEPALANVYKELLADAYTVETAMDGQEALATVSEAVDVVLLDRQMPEISGDEVLREIRARELDCRVAMVSAVEPGPKIVNLPFDEYLFKSVSRSDLCDVVTALRERATYDDQRQELYSLACKRDLLELAEYRASDAYAEVLRRLQKLKKQIPEESGTCGADFAYRTYLSTTES